MNYAQAREKMKEYIEKHGEDWDEFFVEFLKQLNRIQSHDFDSVSGSIGVLVSALLVFVCSVGAIFVWYSGGEWVNWLYGAGLFCVAGLLFFWGLYRRTKAIYVELAKEFLKNCEREEFKPQKPS